MKLSSRYEKAAISKNIKNLESLDSLTDSLTPWLQIKRLKNVLLA